MEDDFQSRVYNGRFFSNGDFYYCSSQDEIKIYDVSDTENWKCVNSFDARGVSWTITDVDLSPDENFLIYSSMNPMINIVKLNSDVISSTFTFSADQHSIPLNQDDPGYGIFSCEFSGSGTEVLVGTRIQTLEIHDLVKKKLAYRAINAHDDDINTACFASEGSQVIYSGSDDSLIKIWDRRASGSACQGVLIGHREGITYLSSKGNGLNLISNGKDQCIKLWDIRKLLSPGESRDFIRSHQYQMGFDYRMGRYPLENYNKLLAADSSVSTFKGHKVLGTLIRCHFSPLETTGQRYIYTGGADGKVWIYDSLTGKTIQTLQYEEVEENQFEDAVCRDVSWHPYRPMIAATSFSGSIYQYAYV